VTDSTKPKTVATIGAGNMAEAILRGLLRAGYEPSQLTAADPDAERRAHLERELAVRVTDSNAEAVRAGEVVILAVKPQVLEAAAASLPSAAGGGGPLYVSIIAGQPLARLRQLLGETARIVRSMPNTPALIGAGITVLAEEPATPQADLELAESVLEPIGPVLRLPERLLDAVTGLSGSGPAYVYLFIEALTEAGVREGIPPQAARALASQTTLGAARMVLETGDDPAVLRERVSSPGGTTVAGLAALEAAGLRAALFAAVRDATARSKELGE